MRRLVRFRNVAVAAALLAGAAACGKHETREQADEAAKRVEDQAADLREAQRELADEVNAHEERATRERAARLQRDDGVTGLPDRVGERLDERAAHDTAEDVTEDVRDVAGEAVELAQATTDLERRRLLRVRELRLLHGVIASQQQLINAIATPTPLTDRARAEVSEKLQVLQMRLDEAGNAIHALQGTAAAAFEDRDDDAAATMQRLEAARADAWEALADGDRLDAAS